MPALVSVLVWAALAPVVTVEGDTACPTPDQVAARVATLLPDRELSAPADVARIESAVDTMRVTLTRPDGAPLGERVIDGRFPCADLAEAAAVVVATWESDVHPEFRPATPEAPPVVVVAAPVAPRPGATYDVGAALTGSLAPSSDGAAPALGALVVGSWTPAAARLGGRVAFSGAAERTLDLGAGQVAWRRVSAALGPQLRLTGPTTSWAFDLHAEGLLAWLRARGTGFTSDRSDDTIDPGLGGGLRALWFGGRWAPWLEIAAVRWLRDQTAFATPGVAAVTLPRFEATVAVGLSFGAK